MLWRKAIPAKQRVKEIEQGLKREFIEIFQDHAEITSLLSRIIFSARNRYCVLYTKFLQKI
jgi:hypothetical protein